MTLTGDASGAELDLRNLDPRLETKRAYYMLALNGKRREVNGANRSLAATIAQAALGRYATGVCGHHDVVRAQVEANALDIELINLDGERSSHYRDDQRPDVQPERAVA